MYTPEVKHAASVIRMTETGSLKYEVAQSYNKNKEITKRHTGMM